MNVWIVNHNAIPPSMGGLVRHYYFSKYLQKKNYNVRIFTASKIHNTDINIITDKSLYKEVIVDDIEYTFVRSRDYSGNGLERILNMVDLPFKMRKTFNKLYASDKPNVIYASSPDLFVVLCALQFGRKYKIPVVVEIRDLWPESIVEYMRMSKRNLIIRIMYSIEKYIYKKADRLVFTFEGGKEYIKDKGWDRVVDLDKVVNINNGVDLDEFEYNKVNYQLPEEDLKDDNFFKVIYVGSIRKVNHLEELVESARIVKARGYDNIKFIIYGDGTEKQQLEELCKNDGLNVVFKGRVEKKYVPYILSRSDLNIINVKKSNLVKYGISWNKFFEYVASEKPILSNLPSNYDLIKKYNLGVSKLMTAEEYADEIIRFSELTKEEYMQYTTNASDIIARYDYKYLTEKVEEELIQACVCVRRGEK
ncbi:glycosyltransferase involved in cell wall biosynthesis [Lachnospiraceae bacterium PF1-22]|uniref:glycosyltransferase family 4 protein n=1 Tax=Ohessyouella blattaphilus TaxID=2949333 RepID=UPI003E18F74A